MQQPTELRWVSFVVLERGKIFFFNKNGIAYSPGEIRHDHLPSQGKNALFYQLLPFSICVEQIWSRCHKQILA